MSDAPKTEMLDVSKLTGDGMDVTFVVVVPGQGEKRYPMRSASMRVGRSDQADIAIKDASVSSKHCDLLKEGGRLVVKDLGSSNGTFLNEQRVQESELNDGDVLRLGNAATVTVSIVGVAAAPRRAPAAQPAEGAGSTMMISANDLDAMRAPPPPRQAPPPARRTAAAPPPLQPAPRAPVHQQQAGGNKGMIVGVAVGVAVVILVGVIGGVLVMKSRARAADVEIVNGIASQLKLLTQATPCAAVQDSVTGLTQLDQGIVAPSLPVRAKDRAEYEKFVEAQRDKARMYKRIATSVEQYVTTTQVSIDGIKQNVQKIGDETLKAKATEVTAALDERMQLSADYVSGWKKLQTETDHYADVSEAVFVKGAGGAAEFSDFHFSKKAPQLHGQCRQAHETSRKDIEEKVAALQALVAK